jgi:hypothetical protein
MRWSCKLTILVLGLAGLGLAGLTGCRSDGSWLLSPPGSVAKQRSNAVVHDPYADNEVGPEVVGARPKDYQDPLSETDRSRLMQRNKAVF